MQSTSVQRHHQLGTLVLFPGYMAGQAPIPSHDRNDAGWHNPQRHGNLSQIATTIVASAALLVALGTLAFNVSSRRGEQEAKVTDEHTNGLIELKLGPATEKMHSDLKEQLSPVGVQLNDLSNKMGNLSEKIVKLESRFEQLQTDQKNFSKISLGKLSLHISEAEKAGVRLDRGAVARLGNDLLEAAPPNAVDDIARLTWNVADQVMGYYSSLVTAPASGVVFKSPDKSTECLSINPMADHWIIEGLTF